MFLWNDVGYIFFFVNLNIPPMKGTEQILSLDFSSQDLDESSSWILFMTIIAFGVFHQLETYYISYYCPPFVYFAAYRAACVDHTDSILSHHYLLQSVENWQLIMLVSMVWSMFALQSEAGHRNLSA